LSSECVAGLSPSRSFGAGRARLQAAYILACSHPGHVRFRSLCSQTRELGLFALYSVSVFPDAGVRSSSKFINSSERPLHQSSVCHNTSNRGHATSRVASRAATQAAPHSPRDLHTHPVRSISRRLARPRRLDRLARLAILRRAPAPPHMYHLRRRRLPPPSPPRPKPP